MPTIANGRIIQDGALVEDDLHVADGLIVDEAADDDIIDADGLIVSPGFIDIQINGGFGHDFTQDPTTIWAVGERLPELGVTSFAPTVVTSPDGVTDLAIDVVANRKPAGYRGAEVLGLHFEGPWISPEMHGAHNPAHIVDPDPATARRWARSGHVRIVTLAPERSGTAEVAGILTEGGVTVSIGHSNADYATAAGALSSYATMTTHLFNQMSPLGHREPGVVGAALLSKRPATLIVDGLHLADGAVELAWRLLGEDRTILVTDAMAAMGLGPGTYPLGDGPITVSGNGPRTTDGRLAGSIATIAEAVRNLMRSAGVSLEQALRAATTNPARALGLGDRGLLTPGSPANVTMLDEELVLASTLVRGRLATDS